MIEEELIEAQGDLDDILDEAHELIDHLNNAECCETVSDFNSNLENAILSCSNMLKYLNDIKVEYNAR